MKQGPLLRGRGISIHKGGYYHEPVTMVSMILYKTLNNFVVKVSKGAKIRNRYNQVPHLAQDIVHPDKRRWAVLS